MEAAERREVSRHLAVPRVPGGDARALKLRGEERFNTTTSLLVFGPRNSLRLALQAIVSSPIFETLVLLSIALSMVLLAMDEPPPGSQAAEYMQLCTLGFTSLFTVPMAVYSTQGGEAGWLSKLWRARYRLYGQLREREKLYFSVFFEVYKSSTPLHRFKCNCFNQNVANHL